MRTAANLTVTSLALALMYATHLSAETINIEFTPPDSAVADAAPITFTFAWHNTQAGLSDIASIAISDYGPQTFVIDETTAASYGIEDWETFSALPGTNPGWQRFKFDWDNNPPQLTALMQNMPYMLGFHYITFVAEQIEIDVTQYEATAPHTFAVTMTITGEGMPIPVPEPAATSLFSFILAALYRRRMQ